MTQPRGRTPAKTSAAARKTRQKAKPETVTPDPVEGDGTAPVAGHLDALGRASSPLRVVVRVHAYPPGHNAGGEWMMHSMLRALVARGHEVSVWLSRYSSSRHPYEVDGVAVIPFAARMDFASAVKQADVIVSHLENVPSAGALARGFGRPFVTVCHNTAPVIFRNVGVGSTALAVYNSEHMQIDAEEYFCKYTSALRPAKSIVVRPPVFADDYRTTPGEAITLINLNADKGGQLFWKLAEKMPHRQFLGVQGAYGQQVLRKGGLPNVEIVPHMSGDQMREQVYARTRMLLVPSSNESWGRVAVEAMASGIPVIANPTPGLAECLSEAAIFAERADTDAWVAALQSLEDETTWAQASERALQRAKELDPAADLAAWCEAVESLTGR